MVSKLTVGPPTAVVREAFNRVGPREATTLLRQALLGEDVTNILPRRRSPAIFSRNAVMKSTDSGRGRPAPQDNELGHHATPSPTSPAARHHAKKLDSLIAAVHQTVQTQRGRQAIRRDTGGLALALRQPQPDASEQKATLAFNVVSGALRRHQIPLGRELCITGIELAAKTQSTATMRRCIDEIYDMAYDVQDSDVTRAAASLVEFSRQRSTNGVRFGAWQRRDALELLTGWKTSGVGGVGELPKVSVASLVRLDRPEMVMSYVEALRQLGAFESIWQSWLRYKAWQMGSSGPALIESHQRDHSAALQSGSTDADLTNADEERAEKAATRQVVETYQRALVGTIDRSRAKEVMQVCRANEPEGMMHGWDHLWPTQGPNSRSVKEIWDKAVIGWSKDGPEDHLCALERLIGVSWVDGEDGVGYHVRKHS